MAKDLETRITDARGAAHLKADPIFVAVMEAVKTEAITMWRNSKTGETVVREEAYHLVLAIQKIERALTALTDDGAIAQVEVNKLKQQEQFRSRRQ